MSTVGPMLVGIATTADGPARFRGRVVTLDRFSSQVALETREPALGQGASIWLHFQPPGGGRPLSVAGIVSGVAPGGQITVLLSLTPGEYNRLQGLPDPQVPRRRRAVPSSLTPPDMKPIQQREVSEPRSKPESPRPGQPAEAPAGIEPDIAGLSPIERARALAAALAELVGPRVEPAPPGPSEPMEAPVETVAPPPEPVSPTPVAPVEVPAEAVAPAIEPVSPSPVEPEAAAAGIEPSAEPPWLKPVEAAEVPVEVVEPAPEPVSVSPVEPAAAPVETVAPPPEPARPRLVEPAEARPPAVKPSIIRMSLIARAKAWAAGLAERVGPSAEPASSKPSQPGEAPAPVIAPSPAPVSPTPVEALDAAAATEPSAELAWLGPVQEAEVPPEVVEGPPEPTSVGPAEHAEALAARGDHEGAWKVYYDALRVWPEDLRLWYGLGLTLSRLNRRKEAEEVFRYVVSRGDPDSEEMRHALHWLVDAASLAEPSAPPVPPAPPPEPAPSAVPAASGAAREPWGTVHGKVTWREPEPPREVFLVIQGLDRDGPRLHTRLPFGEVYEFDRLPPGSYHLIGGVENEWLWDLRFTVEAGQEVALDLSKQNSTNPRARV